ncbi:baseplate J/gp47 family protein [Chryseobacterium sp. LC2016-29]|uniref:baseplate J/gp47 family protein n=1 Tax=Chryseobacterium sp. LC2016-29 TaxID=2897331 RepID=UPI001E38B648|nr:baseplate J/gp47 family protein [Chryseobacterium sp. LC2016-29]MCD0480742.1 baseplate J/gp47 family protein [Chryseobacterium sp. LC2016-29]
MKKTDTFSHYREGKSQMQRFLAELDPGNLELHDFDLFDWLLFANNFARRVNYFDKDDNTTPKGKWGNFFLGDDGPDTIPRRESVEYKSMKKQVADLMSQFEQDSNLTPHLTLFVCFLKLLDFSKKAFNNLTKRHLDFYYNEILQIEKNDAKSDKVYVIFELAKKALQEKIPTGTLLDGDKDAKGKKRVYKTGDDLIANQAKVVEVKSFLNDGKERELKMAPKANTADGLGDKLPEESNYWWPFGYNANETISEKKSIYKELPKAKLGFSVASSLFDLKEGERTITLTIAFEKNSAQKLHSIEDKDIVNNIKVLCSGEKEWLSDIALECLKNKEDILELSFKLPRDFQPVVKYNKEVLLETFQTNFPVVRFMIEGKKYYNIYEALSETLVKNIEISVDVKGVKSIQIENDNGALNSEKPYYPFTAQPIKGSNFFIKCPEMFSKKWKNVDITINWKNTPDSITGLYNGYVINPNQNVSLADYQKLTTSIVGYDGYFKADTALLHKEIWYTKANNIDVFKKIEGAGYQTQFSIINNSNKSGTSESIRLTFNQSSLQDVYPKLYTLALSSGAESGKLIPNEPYIPFAEDIELNYSAKDKVYLDLETDSEGEVLKSEDVQLYHEDAFGQYEKEAKIQEIVPVHKNGGELYIGLEAIPQTTVSLLIQMLEGSENPLVDTFKEKEFIEWSILSGNKWIDLSGNILQNETRKFLESGIVKFKISKDIDTNHTRFTDGLVWIRARSQRSYDAVCKIQGIYTQAVLATFQNQDNDLSHLNNGLGAETISKLITRVAQVKSVDQPYNSFDGKYQETDPEFYRRVSERLRHKHRAITQWDYEHLVLQEFPEVFKVKCLNHTSEKSYMAPGHVTLMVVPNIKNKNAFDVYQPRVSRATLNKIQNYVNELNTMHVDAQVINPNYKEARVEAKVKFFEQYDETFYLKQLDEDIKKYISPWAFTDAKEIDFNVVLNVNQLVTYLEQLHYVDYIDEVKILVNDELQRQALIEVDPKSILVSAKEHKVSITNQVCI